MSDKNSELMTFGGGCFWCMEALFNELKGVEKVVSGYMGGTVPGTPTYREVCSGLTGHAEVIQVKFDPMLISYEDLLVVFMTSHNPTILNKKGGGDGSQYRSVIFYHDAMQKSIAELVSKEMVPYYKTPIMTEIVPLQIFHKAEEKHQSYYANNQEEGYCTAFIAPKLKKLRDRHSCMLKKLLV